MTKILVTSRSFGQVSEEPLKLIQSNGIDCDFRSVPGLFKADELASFIGEYDGVILGADPLPASSLAKAKLLKIVCKHGTGIDNIDVAAAAKSGIIVTNVPETNSEAVADATFGLMIDVARRLSYSARLVREGRWEKIVGTDVCGKALGIIGFGAIGRRVAKRALGFGMTVLVYDPVITDFTGEFAEMRCEANLMARWFGTNSRLEMLPLEAVLKQADFLTLHVPLNEHTYHLIDEPQLSLMKAGSILINAARGGIVNETALYEHLISGHLAGAGLDVIEKEPPTGNLLLTLDKVTLISHIASYSVEAINAVSLACARNIVKFFNGETPDYIVSAQGKEAL